MALELVVAMDASLSVDDPEFELQRLGLATAFRQPDVVEAIEACGVEGIAVSVVQWAGTRMHLTAVDWTVIRDREGAGRFASAVAAAPRLLRGFTGLGGAIRFSLQRLEENAYEGRSKIIDVSSDGRATSLSPRLERDRAVSRGATVNGLAILSEVEELEGYYAAEVIGGQGAFVLGVRSYAEYADAMAAKLRREIACGLPLTQVE